MQTDKVKVDGWGIGREEALAVTERFAEYEGLDPKGALRMRLLAEETLGMVTAIAEDFSALFWLESLGDTAQIHLLAETDMDYRKKRSLIDASKSKRNEAAVGIMGKIREIVETGLYTMDEVCDVQSEFDGGVAMGSIGMTDVSSMQANDYQWSLAKYRDSIENTQNENPEAWDELEKSIVANIADDVRVSVKGSSVEVVIDKKIR